MDVLYEIVRPVHPGLVESIKWSLPICWLGAAPTFAGDRGGMLVWHSDIRASLAIPALDALDWVRAWAESA